MANADSSFVSSLPSFMSTQSGATAPVFVIAPWLSGWFRARLASAPAAFACITGDGAMSMETRGPMAPASVIASWFMRLSLAISLIADAASVISCSTVDSLSALTEKP